MFRIYKIFILFLLFLFSFALVPNDVTALTKMEGWTLSSFYPVGVKVKGGEAVFVRAERVGGTISITGPGHLKLTAKVGGGLEAVGKRLSFTVKSPADAYGVLRIRSTRGVALKKFMLRSSTHTYSYDLESILGPDDYVLDLSLDFLLEGQGGGTVDIVDLSVKEASPAGRALETFFTYDTLTTKMINHIDLPTIGRYGFLPVAYGLLIVFYFIASAVFKRRGDPGARIKAVATAFLVVAVFVTLRMDLRWASMWSQDHKLLNANDHSAIFLLYEQGMGDFFDFIDFVKEEVPEGESVRPASAKMGDYIRLANYRLLPIKASPNARYIWSYDDRGVRLTRGGALLDGGTVIARSVELIALSGDGALYREAVK